MIYAPLFLLYKARCESAHAADKKGGRIKEGGKKIEKKEAEASFYNVFRFLIRNPGPSL